MSGITPTVALTTGPFRYRTMEYTEEGVWTGESTMTESFMWDLDQGMEKRETEAMEMGYHAPREVHTRTEYLTKPKQSNAPLVSTRAEDSTVGTELGVGKGQGTLEKN